MFRRTVVDRRPWLERVLDRRSRERGAGGARPARELGRSVYAASPARPWHTDRPLR